MEEVLDVGCGTEKAKGAIGLDLVDLPGVDVVHDLNDYPWPFEDNSFDKIIMDDIIEHLQQPLKAIEEAHRILKTKGKLYLRIIHWSHRYSVADPTHVRFFTEESLKFFTGETREYYSNVNFTLKSVKIIYDSQIRRFIRSKRMLDFLSHYLLNIKQGMMAILIKQ